ncbi:MAG TPA: DUF302 domain-containing protein [Acidiferrobacterales bacterium]
MIGTRLRHLILAALALGAFAAPAGAEELMMARVDRAFPEAITQLQAVIRAHGYTVSRVQRVDVGLTASGYATAEYRVVFYGKPDEIHALSRSHPELIPYLPLMIVVMAENEETVLVSLNPTKLSQYFPDAPLGRQFARWEQDLRSVFRAVAEH